MKVNGPVVADLRQIRGWTREDLEGETERAVLERAAKEKADKSVNRPFSQRVRERKARGLTVGLGKGAIATAERSGLAYPMTIQILAMALGVHPEDIVIPSAASFPSLRNKQLPSREDIKRFFEEARSNPELLRWLRKLIAKFEHE